MNDLMLQVIKDDLRRHGCITIEPARRDSYIDALLDRLRHVPARISSPTGSNPYRFAERGARGHWMFVWIPEE